MTKFLGPTFGDEVIAAGLGGLPLSWADTDDTIRGRETLTAAHNTTLTAVITAHVPTAARKAIVKTTDFIARFTNAEYLTLLKQRNSDITGNKIGNSKTWDIVVSEDVVDMNKQKVQALKSALVSSAVLTQVRADAIFDTP